LFEDDELEFRSWPCHVFMSCHECFVAGKLILYYYYSLKVQQNIYNMHATQIHSFICWYTMNIILTTNDNIDNSENIFDIEMSLKMRHCN